MKFKFNFKLSLFILLIGLILYCCLGNNFYEGLDQQSSNQSGNETTKLYNIMQYYMQ